jgi:hypothetical protein
MLQRRNRFPLPAMVRPVARPAWRGFVRPVTPGNLFAVQNHPPLLAITAQEEGWLLDVTTGSATQPGIPGIAIEITQWALVLELSGKRVILQTHPAGSEAATFV